MLKQSLFIPLLRQDSSKTLPVYQKLFQYLKESILDGRITPGTKLPSSRQLSQQMGIARNSVLSVYEMLNAEGLTFTKAGSGTYTADLRIHLSTANVDNVSNAAPHKLSDFANKINSSLVEAGNENTRFDSLLKPGQPALSHFPRKDWLRSIQASVMQANSLEGQPVFGCRVLREQIAIHLNETRGVISSADQIMITSGSQQALSILLHLLVNSGDKVYLEDTGYQGVDGLLHAVGAKGIAVDTDEQGICLPDHVEHSVSPQLLIVTPSRSFPLGQTLSITRRLAILEWASKHNGIIIEDDYDSEFIFNGLPIAALQGLDQSNRVVYTGTFSRTLFPGIRLGYLVMPKQLIPLMTQYRRLIDGGLSVVSQFALASFMQQGFYNSHLRRMRKLYQERKAVLDQGVLQNFPAWKLVPSRGGMHSVFILPSSLDDQSICKRAMKCNVELRPLSIYSRNQHKKTQGLVMGYAGYTASEIKTAITRLKEII